MFIIGITGGIGSGKSTVSGILRDRGLRVLDADQISHEVTLPGGLAIEEIKEIFGDRAIREDGGMDREYVSGIVFADNKKLDLLSSVIHKYVFLYIEKELAAEEQKKTKCVVLDVPIPVRKGFVDRCDQIWVTVCDERIRLERLIDRGMSREEALRRIAVQMTDDEYEALADHVIDNSGDLDDTREKVDELIRSQLHERGIRI